MFLLGLLAFVGLDMHFKNTMLVKPPGGVYSYVSEIPAIIIAQIKRNQVSFNSISDHRF
jgi:hypothetical protein